MTELEIKQLELNWAIIVAIVGWAFVVIKILIPHLFLTKEQKMKINIEQKKLNLELQKQAEEKMRCLNIAYQEYTTELTKWIKRKTNPSVDSFDKITKAAVTYFNELEAIALAIVDGNLSDTCIKYTLSPLIKDAVDKNIIEKFYTTIKEKYPTFTGKYNPDNYQTIAILNEIYSKWQNNWWNKFIAFLISKLRRLYLNNTKNKYKS